MVLSDLLPKFKKLRALSLSAYNIIGLPKSIGGLRHLRYLNLSYTKIRSLPDSTVSLFNLQILIGDPSFSNMVTLTLQDCEKCTTLPSLGLLSSLKHLSISGMIKLKGISSEFYGKGCLKPFQSLETLYLGYLGNWEAGSTGTLGKKMRLLKGSLASVIFTLEVVLNSLEDYLPIFFL